MEKKRKCSNDNFPNIENKKIKISDDINIFSFDGKKYLNIFEFSIEVCN